MPKLFINFIFSLTLLFQACAAPVLAAPKEPKFIIGNWAQPVNEASIKKWKESGVNVWFGPEKTASLTQIQVAQKIIDAGMLVVFVPDSQASMDFALQSDGVLWVAMPDEPELHAPRYNLDPAGFQAYVTTWMGKYKWIADQAKGKKPLYINFAGPLFPGDPSVCPDVTKFGCYQGQNHKPYADLTGPGDVLSLDLYPKNSNADRYPNTFIGGALSKLKVYFPGRRYMAYLEASDIGTDGVIGSGIGRAPTVAEMEEQFQIALAQGVIGVKWFTHRLNGGGCGWDANLGPSSCWDMRPADLLAKTKEIAFRMNPTPSPSPSATPTPTPSPTIKPTPRLDAMEKKVQALEAVIQKLKAALQ